MRCQFAQRSPSWRLGVWQASRHWRMQCPQYHLTGKRWLITLVLCVLLGFLSYSLNFLLMERLTVVKVHHIIDVVDGKATICTDLAGNAFSNVFTIRTWFVSPLARN